MTQATTTEALAIHIGPSGPLGGYVQAPPSKNATTRMILAAALAEGMSTIRRPAVNDDARALVRCCRALGAGIEEEGEDLKIEGVAGQPEAPAVLDPGNAGAVLRLLLGAACLARGEVRFETAHAKSLGRRPNRELIESLRSLGADIEASGAEGRLPITVHGNPDRLGGGEIAVDGSRSSQFVSSLLFLAPHLKGDSIIRLRGAAGEGPALVSRPLIDQTLEVLRGFGAGVEAIENGTAWKVEGGTGLRGGDHAVGGDWPSAAALMCAVAAAGGMAGLDGLRDDAQGERRIVEALSAMGCRITRGEDERVFIHGKGNLRAIEFDGDLATDAVLALEGAAALAEGTTRITGIANLALKECDRIRAPLTELSKLGVAARHGEDWVEITGRPGGFEGGIDVDCHGDHRVAQMLAIVGSRCARGLTLRGAECVSKSYPAFFSDLARLGVHVEPVNAED